MKNFTEKIKDFLYDAIDFVLIFVIIIAVAGVIGWRLDILFANDMDKPPVDYIKDDDSTNENIVDNNDSDTKDEEEVFDENDVDNNDNNENAQTDNVESENNTEDTPTNTDTQDTQQDEVITVKIPSGSLPPTIANILLEKGLIDNKMDFLKKSQELKLDTKLKSGEFKIKRNSSLEDIIRTLAK